MKFLGKDKIRGHLVSLSGASFIYLLIHKTSYQKIKKINYFCPKQLTK